MSEEMVTIPLAKAQAMRDEIERLRDEMELERITTPAYERLQSEVRALEEKRVDLNREIGKRDAQIEWMRGSLESLATYPNKSPSELKRICEATLRGPETTKSEPFQDRAELCELHHRRLPCADCESEKRSG